MIHSFRGAVAEARRHGDLYFAALVERQSISAAFGEASSLWQGWIYTPAVTVWVFLSQCLSPDHSCREAVARLAAWRTAQGLTSCSADTGAYCTARDAVPETACTSWFAAAVKNLRVRRRWDGCGVGVGCASSMARRSRMPDTPRKPSRVSAGQDAKGWLWPAHRASGSRVFTGGGRGDRCGHRSVQRKANGRK